MFRPTSRQRASDRRPLSGGMPCAFGVAALIAVAIPPAASAAASDTPAAVVVDDVSPATSRSTPVLASLAGIAKAQRGNARIAIETLGNLSAEDLQAGRSAADLWNAGEHDAALAALTSIADQRALAIGIEWLEPLESEGGIAGFGDVTIDSNDATGSIALDVHPSGTLYSVVQTSTGWRLHRSLNGGQSWGNTYTWTGAAGVLDIDAAVVGNYVYVGYVSGDDASTLRVRRAATTGFIDALYDVQLAFNAAPATIEEVAAASNADDGNSNIFFAALQSDGGVGYHWDTAADGTTFTEIDVGVANAAGGLDIAFNPGDGTYLLFLSYIATDDSVRVARRQSGLGWTVDIVEPSFTGAVNRTAISAWEDVVFVGFRHAYAEGVGLRYRVSYDAADNWGFGSVYIPGAGEPDVVNFDVCLRGGFGSAATYVMETGGEPDEVWFRKRDGYASTTWDDAVQINDSDVLTSTTREPELNWLAPTAGNSNNYRFGIAYPQPDPMFDLRRQCDGDVNESGAVDIDDLLAVVGAWGACPDCSAGCAADISPFSGDCSVDINDLLEVIAFWGPCQ